MTVQKTQHIYHETKEAAQLAVEGMNNVDRMSKDGRVGLHMQENAGRCRYAVMRNRKI